MNFSEWWTTLTPKERLVLGANNARFVWEQACDACVNECNEAHDRYKELWDKFAYDEDEGRMLAASACGAAIKQKVKT